MDTRRPPLCPSRPQRDRRRPAGHGRSGAAKHPSRSSATGCPELLDALGDRRAAIAGHSLGSPGGAGLRQAPSGPVRAVAMVAGTAPMPVSDAILEACANNDHAAFDMLTQWGCSKRHQYGGNSNPGIWMVGSTCGCSSDRCPGAAMPIMNACNNYQAGLERAAQVLPVLMVLGRDDRLSLLRATDQLRRRWVRMSG